MRWSFAPPRSAYRRRLILLMIQHSSEGVRLLTPARPLNPPAEHPGVSFGHACPYRGVTRQVVWAAFSYLGCFMHSEQGRASFLYACNFLARPFQRSYATKSYRAERKSRLISINILTCCGFIRCSVFDGKMRT